MMQRQQRCVNEYCYTEFSAIVYLTSVPGFVALFPHACDDAKLA